MASLAGEWRIALRRPLERRLRTLVLLAAGAALVAYPACAQDAGLADVLAANANCSSVADARASLEAAVGLAPSDTTQSAIVTALREIAGRDDLCAELKEAAKDFAPQAVDDPQPSPVEATAETPVALSAGPAPTSSSIVAATLAEAERRAANLKFEVGPPPRFMTKERISGR
jgi:hypothetical protein